MILHEKPKGSMLQNRLSAPLRAFFVIVSIAGLFFWAAAGVQAATTAQIKEVQSYSSKSSKALRAGRRTEALQWAKRAAYYAKKYYGSKSWSYAETLRAVARVYSAMGQKSQASSYYAKASKIGKSSSRSEIATKPYVAKPYVSRSSPAKTGKRYGGASKPLTQSGKTKPHKTQPQYGGKLKLGTRGTKGHSSASASSSARARLKSAQNKLAITKRRYGSHHKYYVQAMRNLAAAYRGVGDRKTATRLYSNAAKLEAQLKVAKRYPGSRTGGKFGSAHLAPKPIPQPGASTGHSRLTPPKRPNPSPSASSSSTSSTRLALRRARANARSAKKRYGPKSRQYGLALQQIGVVYQRMRKTSSAKAVFAAANKILKSSSTAQITPSGQNTPSGKGKTSGKTPYGGKGASSKLAGGAGLTSKPGIRPLYQPSGSINLRQLRTQIEKAKEDARKIGKRHGLSSPQYAEALKKIARLYRLSGQTKLSALYYRRANAIAKTTTLAQKNKPKLQRKAYVSRRMVLLRNKERALSLQARRVKSQRSLSQVQKSLALQDIQRRKLAVKKQKQTLTTLSKKGPSMMTRSKPLKVYKLRRKMVNGKMTLERREVAVVARKADAEKEIGKVKMRSARRPASAPATEQAAEQAAPAEDDRALLGPDADTALHSDEAAEDDEAYKVVQVFYGTDREDFGESYGNERYGVSHNKEERFSYGVAEVSIPPDHEPGELEAPSILRLELRWNPERHVTLLSVTKMAQDAFVTSLKERIEDSAGKEAFIFVHGYNVTFEDAARRTAQIAHDLRFDGAPIFYSWPSQGTFGGYTIDENNIRRSTRNIKSFLIDVVRKTGATRVHLIGHSMGTRGLTEALIRAKTEMSVPERQVLKEIILASPDIDAGVFVDDIVPRMRDEHTHITMYASKNDEALSFSKRLHGNTRAGDLTDLTRIPEGIDVIDASNIKTSFLGHSFFADSDSILADIRSLIIEKKKLAERYYLKEIKDPIGTYWLFEKLTESLPVP